MKQPPAVADLLHFCSLLKKEFFFVRDYTDSLYRL